jgi:transposase InsO family protein
VGQILHGSATTTHAIRAAIQRSTASLQALSVRYGINPKTVAKWRKRTSVEDRPMGPTPRSTVLSADEEAVIVAFRRHTLLPLDDCLYALQATMPHLTRSSLHRLFQRHQVNHLPTAQGTRPRQRFKPYPLGYLHIDLAEVWTEAGKLYLFVAIDRVSKFAVAELHGRATPRLAADFLRRVVERLPYRIHTVLTNGFQFTPPRGGWSAGEIRQLLAQRRLFRAHAFELACAEHAIEHRLTKLNHPWTNGQVERMNRTIKEATVRRFYYATHESLRVHLATLLEAYDFAKRLKSLKGLTPFERICQLWTEQPDRFRLNSTCRDRTPSAGSVAFALAEVRAGRCWRRGRRTQAARGPPRCTPDTACRRRRSTGRRAQPGGPRRPPARPDRRAGRFG